MSIGRERRPFGATPHHVRPGHRLRPWLLAASLELWRGLEIACILVGITLGNVAVVKIVDALLDALHN